MATATRVALLRRRLGWAGAPNSGRGGPNGDTQLFNSQTRGKTSSESALSCLNFFLSSPLAAKSGKRKKQSQQLGVEENLSEKHSFPLLAISLTKPNGIPLHFFRQTDNLRECWREKEASRGRPDIDTGF
jgi:hypothetical protein